MSVSEEESETMKNDLTKMESCDTLADVDFNFKEMRTCDGPCKEIFYSDQLEIFECYHAVCGECLNELTDIEIRTGKFLCPISTCRHGNAERNVSSAKEYAYLKQSFLHSRRMNFATVSRLTNSSAEASLSIGNILKMDQKAKLQPPLPMQTEEEKKEKSVERSNSSKSQKDFESMAYGSSKIISGTTLVSTTNLCNEPCTSIISTSPDFYENSTTHSSTNQYFVATESDCSSSTRKSAVKKCSAYPLNTSEYDQDLIAELLALSCETAMSCFTEDDFDDCTTAESFTDL
uniref:RING-type domain-containing protein n=1 Tax=Panagrolaimus superbus TaxID=310955 RepID=A0A914XWF4_9BILA